MRIVFLCTSSLDYPSPRGRWLPLARYLARARHEPHNADAASNLRPVAQTAIRDRGDALCVCQ